MYKPLLPLPKREAIGSKGPPAKRSKPNDPAPVAIATVSLRKCEISLIRT